MESADSRTPLSVKDIAWVAGLLEGEGCFQNRRGKSGSPLIQLVMTDKDVVIRAAQIMGGNKVIEAAKPTKTGKPIYRLAIWGRRAASWCMTLYPLMGERRQGRIREVLAVWKVSSRSGYVRKNCTQRSCKTVWINESFVNKAA